MKTKILILNILSLLILTQTHTAKAQTQAEDPLVQLIQMQTAGLPPTFTIPGLENDLQKLSQVVYLSKAPIFNAAIKLVSNMSMNDTPDRLFMMNALLPLIQGTHSEYFESDVIPTFNQSMAKLNSQYHVSNLSDLKAASQSTIISLTLIRYGLDAISPSFGSADDQAQIGQMKAAVGMALASGSSSDLMSFVTVAKTNQTLLLNASIDESTEVVGLMVSSLVGFLSQ